jgi:hypothetical protein
MKVLKNCIYTGNMKQGILKHTETRDNKALHCLHIHFMAGNHNLMCLLTMTVLHVIFRNTIVKMTYI